MPLTRATLEGRLVRSNRGVMEKVGWSTAADGSNADLAAPIASALWEAGYPTADPSSPADADLAAVPLSRWGLVSALADVQTKEALLGTAIGLVTQSKGGHAMNLSDIARRLEDEVARLRQSIARRYTAGSGVVTVGKLAPRPVPPDAVCEPWLEPGTA